MVFFVYAFLSSLKSANELHIDALKANRPELQAMNIQIDVLEHMIIVCLHLFAVEILDFGYPQNSETGALKTFITQQGIKSQVSS